MSTNETGSNNPIDSEEQLSQLIEIDGDSLFEIDGDSLDEVVLEDIWIAGIPLGELVMKALKNSRKAKETSETVKETTESHDTAIKHLTATTDAGASDGAGDNEETTHSRRKTPLERLLDDPQGSGIRITESVGRAISIAGHFKQWSGKVKAGRTILDGLRNLLSAVEDERLAWKQVHRACYKLEELTNGKIEFKNTDRHGRILVLRDENWLAALTARCQRSEGVR